MGDTPDNRWQFWIDRGGTFTDVVARAPDGAITTAKLLSENPGRYADAALEGIRRILDLPAGAPLGGIGAVRMGTTVGTNALLQRQGAPTALVITKGFGDALTIGTQNRPDLFALEIKLPPVLYSQVIEVAERVSAAGEVLLGLDEQAARKDLAAARAAGIGAVAIVLMHGYRYPAHEHRLTAIAREAGFEHVSTSSAVSPLMKLVARGDTTVVDAYLSPLLRGYVRAVSHGLGDGPVLQFMQSNGGLTAAVAFRGKDSILSGPAGGVVGAVHASLSAGFERMVGFDMGGTSTDVCHYAGAFERTYRSEVAGVRLQAPMMDIQTVAAGGGSILRFDGARLRVGPQSAGADPGPACYRRGGPLTLTDANVLLGRIQPAHFPKVFGPGGDQPLDREAVEQGFAALAARLEAASGVATPPLALAEGFVAIAVDNMANAVKKISVQRGHDVTDHVLCCFGGAGGQHACAVADALAMTQVLIPAHAGVLSAIGIGLAEVTAISEQTMETELRAGAMGEMGAMGVIADALAEKAAGELRDQGIAAERITVTRTAHVRAAGSDTALEVPYGTPDAMTAAFQDAHRKRFGFNPEMDPPPVLAALAAEAAGGAAALNDAVPGAVPEALPEALAEVLADGAVQSIPVVHRDALQAPVSGPALVIEDFGTNWVAPGWQAEATVRGDLVLTLVAPRPTGAVAAEVDPVMLEIFNNRFMAVAEQMGSVLENTASSVNIKERLDFSCAIFDGDGGLVANAPHIPVHLGSMAESVRALIAARGEDLRPGDVFVMNAPDQGGTHLPDITVIAPVFDREHARPTGFVGARGHHADIGGTTPGSMPPHSATLAEEGVLLPIGLAVEAGQFREAELRTALAAGPWPARNPDQNIADLKAQVAACAKGAVELRRLAGHYGETAVAAYMGHVQDNGAAAVRRALADLGGGAFACALDDGDEVRVAVTVNRGQGTAAIDFSGTAPRRADNFNAPPAIARAAVLYVFRTLVADDIPLNSGCLRPLTISLPEGSIVNPGPGAAVAAGNVETSQIITDALLGALGALAGSQGTMNNVTFGDDRRQYYETLCGGAGAGPGFAGASGVHSHMTNSRLTDPEVLEARFPVLIESFGIRAGSGGRGEWNGGDGVVRRIRFLEPLSAAILSGRRVVAPHGMAGGEPGATGRTRIERAGGTVQELAGCESVDVGPGDVLVIETPGGGGYGTPAEGVA